MIGNVLFADGKSTWFEIHIYHGACLKGQPTAYVIRQGKLVWVEKGQSVEWVESNNG